MARKITAEHDAAKEALATLAVNIKKVAELGDSIKNSGLKEAAILTLIKDMTGIPKETIKEVLDALPELARKYCK